MRKLILAAAVVALAVTASVVAQRSDDEPAPRRRPAGDPAAPPPEMMGGTRLEEFLMRPGRVAIRDTWRIGRFECRPWNDAAAGQQQGKAFVRINAIVAYPDDRPEERVAGVEVVLEDEFQDRPFLFDPRQIGDLLSALDALATASDKLRDLPEGGRRRAVYSLNALEIGMYPRRQGGYLAPVGPEEASIAMSPDDFAELKRLLGDARDRIDRETRPAADRPTR